MKGATSKTVFFLGLVIVCVGIIGAGAVQAADVSLGLGVGLSPDYEGSEDYAAVPLPYLNVVWPNQMSIDWLGNKAKFNLIPSSTWKGGLIGEYIPERDDVDSSAVDNLDEVDTSIMLGGFFGFEYNNFNASIEAMADMADGNDGAIVRLNGGYRLPINQNFSIGLGAFTTWADDDYMQAYFEIDAADSVRSGLRTFDADAGIKDVGLNFRARYDPGQNWSFMGILSYKRLLNDAEDSPVVEDEGDENQLSGGVIVIYKF